MLRRVAILGSTGSIGKNALRVIDALDSGLVTRDSCLVKDEKQERNQPPATTNPIRNIPLPRIPLQNVPVPKFPT